MEHSPQDLQAALTQVQAQYDRLRRIFDLKVQILREAKADCSDRPSQTLIRDLESATAEELRAEVRRLDDRLRFAWANSDWNQTGFMIAAFKLAEQRDKALAEVAKLKASRKRRKDQPPL